MRSKAIRVPSLEVTYMPAKYPIIHRDSLPQSPCAAPASRAFGTRIARTAHAHLASADAIAGGAEDQDDRGSPALIVLTRRGRDATAERRHLPRKRMSRNR